VLKRRVSKDKIFVKRMHSERELDEFLRVINGDRHNWTVEKEA
jgi:hypothetical protein